MLRSGHKLLTTVWRVGIACFCRCILFSFPRIVCSSTKFLAHTQDISFRSPNLLRTLAVHRIRWRFEPVGAGTAVAIPCCSSVGRHWWHKWLWVQHRWAPSTVTVQVDVENEENMGASDVGQFFMTGPTDVATKPSHFFCRICCKDVSVMTHGQHEILRHLQGSKHFPRDQGIRLDTPSWEMLDYEGNVMSPAEVERQREKMMRAPLVLRDREYPFSEDVIVDKTGAVNPILGVMAKASSLIEVLRLGGSYELVYQLWKQFTLSAVRVNVDVTSSREEVFVSIFICAVFSGGLCASNFVPVLVHHPEWDVSADFFLAASFGQSLTGAVAWSLKRKATKCGCFFAPGT